MTITLRPSAILCVFSLAVGATTCACSITQRARPNESQAQTTTRDPLPASKLAPPPQRLSTVKTPASDSSLDTTSSLFAAALKEHDDGAYQHASELWRQYLAQGFERTDEAGYFLAQDLFFLGRPSEARETLEKLIQQTKNPEWLINARIMLAECLLGSGEHNEALALTFEILPDTNAEKRAGIVRAEDAIGRVKALEPTLAQKVRTLTMRGRILGSLRDQAGARETLVSARNLIHESEKSVLSQEDKTNLTGQLAWREIETLNIDCRNKFPTPKRLSEAEFLAYVDKYYRCADHARPLYCDVLATHDEQIRSQAVLVYRAMVEAPLELGAHLPPPSRQIRKQEQRARYENEMKALIEKTVRARTQDFKNLEFCGARDVF